MSPLFLLIPIFLPILGGTAMLFIPFRRERSCHLTAMAVVLATTALVLISCVIVQRVPVEVYSFTNGFSVDFRPDGLGLLFAVMVALMWPLVTMYAFEYVKGTDRQRMFFGFFVMTFGVTLGICFSSNMTTLYVFYEMLTLVTLPLVGYYGNHESSYAARKYAAYTIFGASLAFFTVVMTTVYGDGGNFAFGGSISRPGTDALMQAAFVFGFFGFGVKAAVFPLHEWLPTASAAPTPVTALLHAVAVVNSGVFAVIRMAWYVYNPYELAGTYAQELSLAAAAFTLVYAAVMAIKERHFKRRLAYSTVSNLSYMLFGVLLLTPAGLTGGMAHMLFHGIIKAALFMCAGAFMHVTGKAYIYETNGVGRKMPWTFAIYTLGALSLTGIPLFCGFVSKWQLISAALEAGTALACAGAAALIVSAFLCAVYVLSICVRAYFPYEGEDRYEGDEATRDPSYLMLVPMAVFAVCNIAFGLFPMPVLGFLERIAAGLL